MRCMCSNIPEEKGQKRTGWKEVPEAVKTCRSDLLRKLTEEQSIAYRKRLPGKTVEVLMEESYERDGVTYQIGHTREYVRIAVAQETSLANRMEHVKVEKFLENDVLCGILTKADRK